MRVRFMLAVLVLLASQAGEAQTVSRLIVKLKEDAGKAAIPAAARIVALSASALRPLTPLRAMAAGAQLVELDTPLSPALAAQVAERLARDPAVDYAVPDLPRRAARFANDEFRAGQGYLDDLPAGISAELAWDVTIGDANTVVAVVDTGILPHADLAGRILPGYDMVSPLEISNDGDGRDADPSDPGDWVSAAERTGGLADCPVSNSSWHGTQVAGVIAANTNNRAWVAGINWLAKILPVRVLGKCHGFDSDILDGIAWAAGLAVPGVPANPNPAQVINLSLGGDGACHAGYQSLIAAVYAHGVTRAIVAAAGNQAGDAGAHTPANCPGVIAVASTTSAGSLARYSNAGPVVALSAPGGQYSPSASLEGILTLSNAGRTVPTTDFFGNVGGTSFAAPMASGVISLMLAVNPALDAAAVRNIVTTTVKPFPVGSDCTTDRCGAGILDAGHAVKTAAATAAPVTRDVVEYYNATLDHYFITWIDAEIANLDAGRTPTRWTRTGLGFRTAGSAQAGTSPVCRYYIPPGKGDSHFFGRGQVECDATGRAHPDFVLEDGAFMFVTLPAAGTCPANTKAVYRVFSGRADANHRYTTDRAVRDQMVAKGWIAEGDGPDLVVMCVLP